MPWIIPAVFLGFIFLIPLETLGHEADSSSITVSRLAGMALVGVCLLRPRLLLRWPERTTWWAFILMTLALIRTAWLDSGQVVYAAGRYSTWLQMLVFFHLAQPVLGSLSLRLRALHAYIAGAAVTAGFLLQGAGLNSDMLEKGRAAVGNLDPNVQAAVLGLAAIWLAVLLLGQAPSAKRPWFWLGWMSLMVLVSANLLTGSRGGLLALCATLLALPLLGRGRRRWLLALLVALGLGLIALVVEQNDFLTSRIMRSIEEGDTAGRDYLITASLDLWRQRPLLGWGLGANEVALGEYTNTPLRDMHSIYLYALTAVGAVGVFLLAGMLGTRLRSAWCMRPGIPREVALAGLLFILIFGGTVTILFFKFFWVALAMATPVEHPAFSA